VGAERHATAAIRCWPEKPFSVTSRSSWKRKPSSAIRGLEVAGDQDLLGLRQIRHAKRLDHGLAEELVLVAQRVAAVEPDAQADRAARDARGCTPRRRAAA
jgi:hypothetical protein